MACNNGTCARCGENHKAALLPKAGYKPAAKRRYDNRAAYYRAKAAKKTQEVQKLGPGQASLEEWTKWHVGLYGRTP